MFAGENNSYSPFGAVTGIDITSQKVMDHQAFGVSKRFTIAGGGAVTADIVIDTTTNKNYIVFLPTVLKAYGAGSIEIDFYLNPTVTAATGTQWVATDRNNVNPVIPDTTVLFNPTVTDVGTKLPPEWEIFSNGIAAVSKAGGETGDSFPFNAMLNSKYMFRLKNLDAADTARLTASLTWFEL